MKLRLIALAALAIASAQAHADTVGLWDFSSFSCTPGPCTTIPKPTQTANGGSLSMVGGVTFTSAAFGTGNGINTTSYAAQGTGNLTTGLQFLIDTSGYTDLVLTFSQRNSNTGSSWTTLQYTTDGTSWLPATTFQATSTAFVNGLTYDFTNVVGVNDNASFGIRFVASFAPGTNAYAATTSGQSYNATSGTIRYDNVLLSGTPLPDLPEVPVDPVPEPQTVAMLLAGLASLGLIARRRRAD